MHKDIVKGLAIGGILVGAALTRVFPHPLNFTPMVAIILFSAAYLNTPLQKIGFGLFVIFISDLILEAYKGIGFHEGTPVVYASYALMALISYYFLRKVSAINVLKTSLIASLIFFLCTNFAYFYPESSEVNLALGTYPHNLEGIKASYIGALPFFRNSLIGDLFFTGFLFSVYYLIIRILGQKTVNA